MKRKFPDIMERLFSDLLREFYELEAELNKLKDVSKTTYEDLLKERNYEEFERLIGIMYRTSSNQSETFERMHRACLELIKMLGIEPRESRPDLPKKRLNELIAKIKAIEKQGLALAEKLPFSLDGGWAPQGGISNFRKIVNIPGYLLLAPYLVAKRRQNLAMLEKSLYDLRKSVITIRKIRPEHQTLIESKELIKALKDFNIFISITNQLHRKFKKLHQECEKIYWGYDLRGYSITEETVYEKTDVGSQWKAA